MPASNTHSIESQDLGVTGKAQRALAAKQHRDAKRADMLAEKRAGSTAPKARSPSARPSMPRPPLSPPCSPAHYTVRKPSRLRMFSFSQVVAFMQLCGYAPGLLESVMKAFVYGAAAGSDAASDEPALAAIATAAAAGGAPVTVACARHKQRFTLLRVAASDLLAAVEAIKVADLLVVAVPASRPAELGDAAAALLPSLRAQAGR